MVQSNTARVMYTITVSDGVQAVTLVNGQARVTSAVPMGEYRYFRAVAVNNGQDLQFGVVPTTGMVTMYISRGNKNPSSLNYTWMATSTGGFAGAKGISVVIPRAQIVPGYYYVGIRTESTAAATYSVIMTTTSLPMTLGTAQQAQCDMSGMRYFRLNLGVNLAPEQLQDLTFLVTPANWDSAAYTGRFNIYVSRVEPYPTAQTAMWSSGNTALTLNQEWTVSNQNWELVTCVAEGFRMGTGCEIYIAVSCIPPSSTTSYLLTVSTGRIIFPLIDQVPRTATIAAATPGGNGQQNRNVYVSYVTEAKGLWLMSETCRGHQNLFVSRLSADPNAANAQYRSVKTLPGIPQSVVITEAIANQQFYSAVQATTANTQYRMWSIALKGRQLTEGAAARPVRHQPLHEQGR